MTTKAYILSDKKENLNGVVSPVDENFLISWENDSETTLTTEEFEKILESEDYEISEVDLDEDVDGDTSGSTPAAATIATHKTADANDGDADGNPKTKFQWIQSILGNLAQLDLNSLSGVQDQVLSLIGGEGDRAGLGNNAKGNQDSIAMKPSAAAGGSGSRATPGVDAMAMESIVKLQNEEVDAVFGESELTEEAKAKIKTIFETAVNIRVQEENIKLAENYEKKYEESINALTNELIEGIDTYCDHVASEWLKENEVAIESTLKSELTEEFMNGLRQLFIENYIDIPEERVDILEGLVEDLEKSKKELNDKINESLEKDKVIKALKKDNLVESASVNLTLVQKDKLKKLIETVDFDNEEAFKDKIKTIKESFVEIKKNSGLIIEGTEVKENNSNLSEADQKLMNATLKALKKTDNLKS